MCSLTTSGACLLSTVTSDKDRWVSGSYCCGDGTVNSLERRNPKKAVQQVAHNIVFRWFLDCVLKVVLIFNMMSIVIGRRILCGLDFDSALRIPCRRWSRCGVDWFSKIALFPVVTCALLIAAIYTLIVEYDNLWIAKWVANSNNVDSEVEMVGKEACEQKFIYCLRPALYDLWVVGDDPWE